MENCIGKYRYARQIVDCPVKWKCENYAIRGKDRRVSSVKVVKGGVPSCFDWAFKDVAGSVL